MASFIGTFFCHPDAHLGLLFAGAAMGQGLSLPMMAVGVWMVLRGSRAAPRQHSGKAPGCALRCWCSRREAARL
jgi:phosphatidylglycerol:prolipoprotein diacylglycerol transferase